jgi:transglutaminase-like putative cysteine protease
MPRRLLAAAALAALAIALSPESRADGFGLSLDALQRAVLEAPGSPAAELVALEAFAQWDQDPAGVRALLERMLAVQGLHPAARERALDLLAAADLRQGRPDAASSSFERRGFVSSWRVLGPLAPDAADAPMAELLADREHDGVRGQVRWRPAPRAAVSLGRLRLGALFSRHEEICAVAATSFRSERPGRAALRLSAAGAFSAFWNGVEVAADPRHRERAEPDRLAVEVDVRAGPNLLAIRVCSNAGGAMELAARLTDDAFSPWPGDADATDLPAIPATDGAKARPRRERRTALADKADAALYALLTGAVYEGSHAERDGAKAACNASTKPRPCLIWSALAIDPNERRRAIDAALARHPGSPEASVALARLEMDNGDAARALLALESIPDREKLLAAELTRLEILASRGFPLAALARLEPLVAKHRDVPALSIAAARLAAEAGVDSARLRHAASTTASRFDIAAPHLLLARAAAARSDSTALDAEIRALLAVAPTERATLFEVAAVLDGAARIDEAEAVLRRALELDPDDAEAMRRLGTLAIRDGRRDEGLRILEQALRRDPGDAWLSGYLDAVAPSARFEAPFVVPPEVFLSWRGGGEDAAYLVDSQVVHVEASGLSSRYSQIVVEVRGEDAAKRMRTHTVEFTPTAQRVKILAARVFRRDGSVENAIGRGTAPISEPWYRLYYDLEAEIVELPSLDPGDVVEYAYRVDDTEVMRSAEGYFGDFEYAVDELPKKLWRYALIAPAATKLEMAIPDLPGLSEEVSSRSGETTRVLEAHDVPALASEPGMPGDSAGRAYLHVSTFRTFDELGRWYEGLIRDQLVPDDRIRAKALALTARAATPAEKAAAIYDWVVTGTRYVGLEFGVHGYKPYRAASVMSRGFGDCKDKAGLLVTLLAEVGIDAEMVLVRTRSRGNVGDAPASLEVFNHAIAYVPKLDLWLDGTAAHHGSRELAFEDQDALALRLTRDGPLLTRTPSAAAKDNSLTERLRVSLDADGRAHVSTSLELRGAAFAPAYRREFEAVHHRGERFAAVVADRFPGSEIESASFAGLDALEGPVRVRYEAAVASLGRVSGREMRVAVDKGERLSERYAALAARSYPLEIGARRVVTRESTVEVPPGFRVARLPDAARIETEFGALRLDAAIAGGAVRLTRRFELDAYEITPEAYPRFAAFCRAVDQALAAPIVFERSP